MKKRVKRQTKIQNIINSMIKHEYGFEEYLNQTNDFKTRKSITQFRISAHYFPIEKERHKNTLREQRKCTICNNNQLGNEFHYLFQCTHQTLEQIGSDHINIFFKYKFFFFLIDNLNLFKYIVSMKDKNLYEISGSFIHNIMECYKSITKCIIKYRFCKIITLRPYAYLYPSYQ